MTGIVERAITSAVKAEVDLAAECRADIATIHTLHDPPHVTLRTEGIDEVDEATEVADSFVAQFRDGDFTVVSIGVYPDGDAYAASVEAEVETGEGA